MAENEPYLVSCNPLKPEYEKIRKIQLNCDNFTLGRGKHCSALIPVVLISRTHCTFKKVKSDEWTIEDSSLCGITINGDRLGKGSIRRLAHEDIITLEPTKEFVYKFVDPNSDMFEVPRKRIKLEPNVDDNLIKIKFEENQTYEMKHLEEKLHNTQQQMTTTKILKDQLELDMSRKILQLENDFAEQIENLKGEKDEVERQKATLIEERDAQLAIVKDEMEGKIAELMDQIKKHNETETELLNENNLLKEKLLKEREEFMLELNRATSSKDELLQKLEAKAKEQEEIRLKEKQQWEEQLRIETELLTLAKEQEIQELEEQRKQREEALMQELDAMKRNLELQEEQTALQRREAEQQLSRQKEEMQKLSDEDKVKMEQLMKEREEIEKKLSEAEINAQKSIEEAKERVKERETQLAAIANERIQKEAEQSHEVISCLQQQLEKLRDQLKTVETEKNTLLETLGDLPVVEMGGAGEGSSKQAALAEVGELVENELQCSICAEQFIQATTLNCSHSFCKYCITMWKKKKKDCPICRAPITSECKSLVIDSFIDKMVETQSVEVRKKRQDLLKAREELETELARALQTGHRGGASHYDGDSDDLESAEEEEEWEERYSSDEPRYYGEDYDVDDYDGDDYGDYDIDGYVERQINAAFGTSDSDSGSDSSTNSNPPTAAAALPAGAAPAGGAAGAGGEGNPGADQLRAAAGVSNSAAERSNRPRRRRTNRSVPGIPGSYYGGYGRCYHCQSRGHWAPGCPYR
ncbi:hypothetical protein O0L34_g2103 [Tuta absoluta]|nr:hypothetical protein O0L34_g2103 [Tuta absoluta]